MKNDYEIRGEVTAIIINSPKYGRQEALINTSKLERVKEFPNAWYLRFDKITKSFYAQGNMPKEKGNPKTISLHRWITMTPKGMVVDHRDHETLNNTDSNLRVITNPENGQNRKGASSKNKTSGIRGVCWHKKKSKWQVYIAVNKKAKHVGYFNNVEEAEHAAIEARMHHMPFSNELI